MQITSWNVYNLAGAVVGSGLPMLAEYDEALFNHDKEILEETLERGVIADERTEKHFDRAIRLARLGSPHCNFMTGILVVFNVTATQAFFLQAHRYHWWQVVSSQSKMHRLKKMLDTGAAAVNGKVEHLTLQVLAGQDRNDVEAMVYNCPMGLETTEQVATNYMQLRTIYAQRHSHRLQEWRDFCAWVETLPMAGELILGKEDKGNE